MAPPAPSRLRVRVPGSTSNLGPGFDLLGLALSLHLRVLASPLPAAGGHELVPDEETTGWPLEPGRNLLVQAFEHARPPGGPAYRFEVGSEIPLARGVGSSGAAIAAGLLLGNALREKPRPREELCRLGIELEGHPENVVASLLGGAILAHPALRRAPTRVPVSAAIGFALAWPREPMLTSRARQALPASVPFGDALENPRRLAFLLEGLRTADPELLAFGGEDRLHVPYRLPLIPGAAVALRAARESGSWLATLSGSGSALIALGEKARIASIASAMRDAFEASTGSAQARVVEPVDAGPEVDQLGPA